MGRKKRNKSQSIADAPALNSSSSSSADCADSVAPRNLADAFQEKEAARLAEHAATNDPEREALLETDMAAELTVRRRMLIEKSVRRELEGRDLMDHEVFIEARAKELLVRREQLAQQHRLAHARLKLASRTDKRGANIGKMAAAVAQGEAAERAVETLNANVQRLHAEADWLHASAGWKQLLEHLRTATTLTASGEVLSTAQLEEDEALYGEGGELTFDSLLQCMKEEAGARDKGESAKPAHVQAACTALQNMRL